jgi:hypothetical protein
MAHGIMLRLVLLQVSGMGLSQTWGTWTAASTIRSSLRHLDISRNSFPAATNCSSLLGNLTSLQQL